MLCASGFTQISLFSVLVIKEFEKHLFSVSPICLKYTMILTVDFCSHLFETTIHHRSGTGFMVVNYLGQPLLNSQTKVTVCSPFEPILECIKVSLRYISRTVSRTNNKQPGSAHPSVHHRQSPSVSISVLNRFTVQYQVVKGSWTIYIFDNFTANCHC